MMQSNALVKVSLSLSTVTSGLETFMCIWRVFRELDDAFAGIRVREWHEGSTWRAWDSK